jgi:intraflagellar transport protein 80
VGKIADIKYNFINSSFFYKTKFCFYKKVWDTVGRQLFVSQAFEYPITSLAWAPDGSNFAVGSYNTIRLCDSAGVCLPIEKFFFFNNFYFSGVIP